MPSFTFKYDPKEMLRHQVDADGRGHSSPLPASQFIQHVRDAVWVYGDVEYTENVFTVTFKPHGKHLFDKYVANGFNVYGKTFKVTPVTPWDEHLTKIPRAVWRLHTSIDLLDTAERMDQQQRFLPPGKLIRCPTHVHVPGLPELDDYSPEAPFSPRRASTTF
jgi:hypothetical protein